MNYLRPSVKRGQIAPDEEDLILRLHRLLEETGRPYRNITIKSGENLKFAKPDQYHPIPAVLDNSNENWQNSDGSMMGFQSGHGNNNREDDIGYCNEETFMISSFLNSFINEDVFENQQLQLPNGIAPSSDSMASSVQNFNNGTVWGDGLTSTMADLGDEQNALNQTA
ncbi:hypothetical protein L1049_009159 [Liquidambar formosana]|uniref:Uncharacterized protein n=1 Tax=Liquidambar formosana TaxID=63359 RepID=A0AAP0X674_LIQFO